MRTIIYIFARALIHAGLFIMPRGPGRDSLLRALWRWRQGIDDVVNNAKER